MSRRISKFDINMFCANQKCASTFKPIKNETEGNSQCPIFYGTATIAKAMRYSQYVRTTRPCIYRNLNNETEITEQTLINFIYGDVETVQSLLLSGSISDINAYDSYNWNALSRATYDNNIEKVQILINAGVNINANDNRKWTALNWARTKNYTEMFRLLVDNGAIYN